MPQGTKEGEERETSFNCLALYNRFVKNQLPHTLVSNSSLVYMIPASWRTVIHENRRVWNKMVALLENRRVWNKMVALLQAQITTSGSPC